MLNSLKSTYNFKYNNVVCFDPLTRLELFQEPCLARVLKYRIIRIYVVSNLAKIRTRDLLVIVFYKSSIRQLHVTID